MDPLSAFSLACGIIQVVDFSIKAGAKLHELYSDGAISENREVQEMASHLNSLCQGLQLLNQQSQDEVQVLGRKCADTAQELISLLQQLELKRKRTFLQVASKAIKNVKKKSQVVSLQKKLDNYRRLIDSRILINLRQKSDLIAVQQNDSFQELDKKVQAMIRSLAEDSRSFDELKMIVTSESESVMRYISRTTEQHEVRKAEEEYRKTFLKSLWYSEIYRRQESIKDAHAQTFSWIFKESESDDHDASKWHNFGEWLRNENGTYWMSGKAGSGKSTLMNYVCQDNRTQRSLSLWSQGRDVLIPSFFFWNSGADMEKNSEGMLRSLIYQILDRYPTLIPLPNQLSNVSTQIPVWTMRRLRNTLQSVLSQVEEYCHICFFLDGLDELIGDQDELIALMEQMRSKTVKICLSSRPDRIYQNAFGRSARLNLQDLTKADITAYVNGKLQSKLESMLDPKLGSRLQRWDRIESSRLLLDDIVDKAKGVFLWVELVVRDLLIGLANDDSFEQLEQRVNQIPSSIRGLYAWMLGRIDPCHRKEASILLQMILSAYTRSFLDIALALDEDLHNKADLSVQQITNQYEKMGDRIPTITAGLCEVFSPPYTTIKKEGSPRHLLVGSNRSRQQWRNLGSSLTISETDVPLELSALQYCEVVAQVNFHHRTATEFLQESEQAKNFLSSYTPQVFRPLYSLCSRTTH